MAFRVYKSWKISSYLKLYMYSHRNVFKIKRLFLQSQNYKWCKCHWSIIMELVQLVRNNGYIGI